MAGDASSQRGIQLESVASGVTRPRVLVPIDLSDTSSALLDRAASVAASMDAEVDILHVWPRPVADRSADPGARLALARVALAMEDLRLSIVGRRVGSSRLRIAYGSAAESIIRIAAEGYNLVVLGSHHSTECRSPGGVVARVTAGAACPVLAVERP